MWTEILNPCMMSCRNKEVAMRIILTGGTGLIGRALSVELARAGFEVIALSRNPSHRAGMSERVTLLGWDGQTGRGWTELVDGATAIVNLAGESLAGKSLLKMRWTPERKREIIGSRVQAGSAVAEAVRNAEYKPLLVVQASAVGYYGPRGNERVTEEEGAGKDFMAEICVNWEASTTQVENFGVRRVVIRLGIVLSRSGGALPRQMIPFRLYSGGPIGNGQQGYPWVHISDVCRAIRFLIETPSAEGVFNLCAPQPLTNAEFGRALAGAMHRPYWLPIPALAFKVAFGEAATILLDGQKAYPQRLLNVGFEFQYPEIGAALANL
jgi:uncharacterized protein (TIGR01777 family)